MKGLSVHNGCVIVSRGFTNDEQQVPAVTIRDIADKDGKTIKNASFRIGVYSGSNDEGKAVYDTYRCVAWGKLAEKIQIMNLNGGEKLSIAGNLTVDHWQDKTTKEWHAALKIRLDECELVQFVSVQQSQQPANAQAPAQSGYGQQMPAQPQQPVPAYGQQMPARPQQPVPAYGQQMPAQTQQPVPAYGQQMPAQAQQPVPAYGQQMPAQPQQPQQPVMPAQPVSGYVQQPVMPAQQVSGYVQPAQPMTGYAQGGSSGVNYNTGAIPYPGGMQ